MSSTQNGSVYEQDAAERPVPGALLVFSVNAAQLRAIAAIVDRNAEAVR